MFLRACRREQVPYTPVWFMRMAGRSLPEYRKVRANIPMLQACARPDLVVEVTLQPVRRYPVDAAILFSDIVVPLKAVGVDLEIKPGVGPVVASPISDAAATLASYLIEGGPSKNHERTKALMYGIPGLWAELMDRLADITIAFLSVQIEAGASAVQVFDSWVGAVSPEDYRRSVLPHSRKIFAAIAHYQVPRIHFGVGTGELLGQLGEAGADVVGVDWRVPLDEAVRRVEPGKALQGNLDPAMLFAPWEVIAERTRDVIGRGRTAEGHIFNLGHGVIPATDPAVLARLAEFVHEESVR